MTQLSNTAESHVFSDEAVTINSDHYYEILSRQHRALEQMTTDRNPVVHSRLMNFCLCREKWAPRSFLNVLQLATNPAFIAMSDGDRATWNRATDLFEKAFAKCESPLEEMFLVAVVRIGIHGLDFFSHLGVEELPDCVGWWPRSGTRIFQQLTVGRHRVDFAFIQDTGAKYAVEMDGHNYHSSRDALARDKGRDRLLHESGFRTLRFTYDEVWGRNESGKLFGFDAAAIQVHKILTANDGEGSK